MNSSPTRLLGLLLCCLPLIVTSGCRLGGDDVSDNRTSIIDEDCQNISSAQCPSDHTKINTACPAGATCKEISFCDGAGSITCQKNEAQCLAAPSCDQGYSEVAGCEQSQADCKEVSVCGTSIFCQRPLGCEPVPPPCPRGTARTECTPGQDGCVLVADSCQGNFTCGPVSSCTAIPVCDPGYSEVEVCKDIAPCEKKTECGTSILCQLDQANNCDAIPSCKEGYKEVQVCAPDDTPGYECVKESLCGTDILCERTVATCKARPVCGSDEVQVEDKDGSCRERGECKEITRCGQTIVCQSDVVTCDAEPSCPDKSKQVSECSANGKCFKETLCKQSILCEVEPAICLALPVCPFDYEPVDVCPANTSCQRVITCGQTLLCAPTKPSCKTVPNPSCEDGSLPLNACPRGAACRAIPTGCGSNLYCKYDPNEPVCLAEAVCPRGSTQTVICDPSKTCFYQSTCGRTIICQR